MLKRDFRLFLQCLLPAAALTVVFAAVCAAAALAAVKGAEEVYTPVKAAVVDQENSLFSRTLVHAVAKTDYIADLLEITSCSMEEAQAQMEAGELAAVIVLPEAMIGDILSGTETKGTIWLSPAAAAHGEIAAGAAAFGELFLTAGQYAIFSGQELIWERDMSDGFQSAFLEQANGQLLGAAMEAGTTYFEVQITDYADTAMSAAAYYAASWLTLLLMLSTLFFTRLYTADCSRDLLCCLKGVGISDGSFLLGKLLYPAAFQMLILLAACMALAKTVPLNWETLPLAVPGIVLSAVICGAVLVSGHRGTVVTAAVSLVGLLLCGGIIPRQLLPEGLLQLGALTPYGAVQGLILKLFGGKTPWQSLLAGGVYLMAGIAAACAGLRRVRRGGEA